MMQVVFEHGRLARDGLSLSRDSLVSGAFRHFDHDHSLSQSGETTVMRDVFDFESPPDILGRPSKTLFLTRYMRHFLVTLNALMKDTAETDQWTRYLPKT